MSLHPTGRCASIPAMDVVVIEFEGGIDEFPRLIQTVDGLLADGELRLVLDLHSLPFMNSSALGYLIKIQQVLRELHGQLALVGVQPAILNILSVTNLDSLFRIFPSVDKALEEWGVHGHAPAHPDAPAHAAASPRVKRRRLSSKH